MYPDVSFHKTLLSAIYEGERYVQITGSGVLLQPVLNLLLSFV